MARRDPDSTTNRNLSRKGPCRTPGTAGRPESPTPSTPLQMGTSTFPLPKPPMTSPTKSPPSSVHGPPTPSISSVRGYNVATGTTRCRRIFWNFCGGNRDYFCNLQFCGGYSVWMLNNLENIIRRLWLCWYMQLCRLEWFRVLWM
jgi:hypothetical protein